MMALVAPCLRTENTFREIAPDIAVAKPEFVEKMKEYLLHVERAWSPTNEQVPAALSLLRSDRGKGTTLENSAPHSEMERSLARIDDSRFQVFRIVIEGRQHLFVNATPLESDASE